MKSLYIARHAKSSWRDIHLNDIDRPLKASGIELAYETGATLQKQGIITDTIISSPAIRALHTALVFAREINFPTHRIQIHDSLYECAIMDVLNTVKNIPNNLDAAMLVGHDPTFTNLANFFLPKSLEKIKTGAVVQLFFTCDHWNSLDKSCFQRGTITRGHETILA